MPSVRVKRNVYSSIEDGNEEAWPTIQPQTDHSRFNTLPRPRRRAYSRVEGVLKKPILATDNHDAERPASSAATIHSHDDTIPVEIVGNGHHHDDIVEHLDVIGTYCIAFNCFARTYNLKDPQVATVSNLTNAANSILM